MAAVKRQVAKQMHSWVVQLPLTSAAPLSWETLFCGSGISEKAKRIFLPQNASEVKFWRAQSCLCLTPIHICAFMILFAGGPNQVGSLNMTPRKRSSIPKEKLVTNSTDKPWHFLQNQGNAYRQRSCKINSTSVQTICLPFANLSRSESTWTHCYYKKILLLSSSKWVDWTYSIQRREILFCLSLSAQDCGVMIISLRGRW